MKNRSYYGVIGNGETCAFVSPQGNIEWLCLPKFDGQIVFSKAVNNQGGSLDIQINDNGRQLSCKEAKQEYIEKTAILKTTLKYSNLLAELTDFMPWPEPEAFESEKRMIFRLVNLKNKSKKTMTLSLKIRSSTDFWTYRDIEENNIVPGHGYAFATTFLGNLNSIKLKPGESKQVAIVFVYGKNAAEVKKVLTKKKLLDPDMQFKKCINFWYTWWDKGYTLKSDNKAYRKAYISSLIIMKLMNYEKTGSIMAAATTSLPASPVGTHSWDYRFTWIRDAYYACRAFLATGHFEEVKKQLAFFYKLQERNGHWDSPFYTIDGKEPGDEIEIDLGGEILRLSNGAKNQLQLDSEGSVVYATYLYYLYSKDLKFLEKHWKQIRAAAEWTSKNFNKEENGIWEFRNRTVHWVYGKVMCYLCMEAAMKISDILKEKTPKHWGKVRSKIKSDVVKHGWSNHRKAFLQSYDEDSAADVSVMALEDYGLVKPMDKKMKQTIKLIEDKLNMNGGFKRNEDAQLPFYFTSLWIASHYLRAGNKKRATEIIKTCLESSTSLYLMAEHFDARNKMQYGNFPQTFNTSMLIERLIEIENKGFEIEKLLGVFNKGFQWATRYDTEELIKHSEKALEYGE